MDAYPGRRRSALVTGAGRGIGRAVALRLAANGLAVAVNDLDAEAARAVAGEVASTGGSAVAVPGDVAHEGDSAAIVAGAVSSLGSLDVLVNNAGVEHRAPLSEHSGDAWERVIAVNLTAPFRITQHAMPHLSASGSGAIVNICSIAVIGFAGQAAYDASKGGLLTLTRSVAVELGRHGVRANAVCPGFIRTDMLMDGDLGGLSERVVAKLPLARLGEPEDVAHAVAWLASDEAAYVTGHALFVDGGMVRS